MYIAFWEKHKAIMDSAGNNHAPWELMKEILQTKVGYKMISKIEKLSYF